MTLDQTAIHPSWQPAFATALATLPNDYINALEQTPGTWLPGAKQIFNAFSLPKTKVRYVLLGESPYPRAQSANGYAFWDAAVERLWSPTGLSKAVNRATSLRNFIKMLFVSEGLLSHNNTSQQAISNISKAPFVSDINGLFSNLLKHGFLLLNATPVFRDKQHVTLDAKYWQPFLIQILSSLCDCQPKPTLLLFGRIAQQVASLPELNTLPQCLAPHPYNLSFIQDFNVQSLFAPLRLLYQ